MSNRGPVIVVTVTGDSKDASKAFKTVGDDATKMGDKVDTAGTSVHGSLGKMTEAADGGERRFRGMNDTIGGTQGLMDGLSSGSITGVIQGLTDLAGGVADFAGPALTKMAEKLGFTTVATEAQTVAQEESNIAMAANPIGLIVIALVALVAAFYLAWTHSETFRNIVTGAFDAVKDVIVGVYDWVKDNWPLLLAILTGPIGVAVYLILGHWDAIKGAFTDVKTWIGEKVDDVVGFLTGLPGRLAALPGELLSKGKELGGALIDGMLDALGGIGHALGGIADVGLDFAKQMGRAVLDFINTQVIDRFNRAVEIDFSFHGVGVKLNPPDVPHLGGGGIVRARPGGVLALLAEAGQDELVTPLNGRTFGSTTVHNYWPAGIDPRRVAEAQRRYDRWNGTG